MTDNTLPATDTTISAAQPHTETSLEFYCWAAGDADCLLLKTPGGRWGVIDCGLALPDQTARGTEKPWSTVEDVKAFLHSQEVKRLAFIILTHPESDHTKGLYSLLLDFEVQYFFAPPGALPRRSLHELAQLIWERNRRGETESIVTTANQIIWDEPQHSFRLVALGPTNRDLLAFATSARRLLTQAGLPDTTSSTSTELTSQVSALTARLEEDATIPYIKGRPPYNRLSVVTLAFYGKSRLLLGADALASSWRELAKSPLYKPVTPDDNPFSNPRAQVFKVPHHGANDGMPLELAETFLQDKAVSVVSSSGHSFASPSADLLGGLTRLGHAPYCTGRSAWCPGRFVGRPCCGLIKVKLFQDGRIPSVESEQNWRTSLPVMCSLEVVTAETLRQKPSK